MRHWTRRSNAALRRPQPPSGQRRGAPSPRPCWRGGKTARLAVLEAELGVAAAARAETEAALAVLDAAAAYEDIVEQAIFGARDFNIAALALAEPGA